MAARTIEARAIFTAQDRSGNVFSFIAKKVDSVEQATKRAQSRIDAFNRANSKTSQLAHGLERTVAVTSRATGLHHMVAGMAAAAVSGEVAHRIIEEGSKRVHERVRMEASGMGMEEIEEASKLSAKLSREFKPINETETMHMLRNARSIVGSYQEAAEIMQPLMKLRVIAQANRPGQDVSEDFDQLVKGLEIKGVTQHPEQFKQYMEGIARGLNVFGDTLKPYQYYEMFKYGRQATPGLSSDFILSTAPTLAQELGGSSYGNAVSGFNRAIVAGRMEHASLKEMYRLGLVDKGDLDFLKSGEVKGLKSGHSIKGAALAQSDPNEWVKQYFLPALEKLGITGANEVMKEVGVVLSNRMAAQLVGILATQQSRIEKDRALIHRAPGLDAAYRYMERDFSIALHGLRSQMENAAASIGAPLAEALTPMVNAAAEALANFTKRLDDGNEKRRNGERSEGEKDWSRIINSMFGIDSDTPVGQLPDSAWRDRDLKQKREKLTADADPEKQREAEEETARHWDQKRRYSKGGGPVKLPPMVRAAKDRSLEILDAETARRELRELDWATLQRMVAESNLRDNEEKRKATVEPFNRLDRKVRPTVPGSMAMPLSVGYGAVDRPLMSAGRHAKPEVEMPASIATAPIPVIPPPPPPQKMQVAFEPVKVESSVKVDASSQLLSVLADAKNATKQARAFAMNPGGSADPHASGPGSLGATKTGQQ